MLGNRYRNRFTCARPKHYFSRMSYKQRSVFHHCSTWQDELTRRKTFFRSSVYEIYKTFAYWPVKFIIRKHMVTAGFYFPATKYKVCVNSYMTWLNVSFADCCIVKVNIITNRNISNYCSCVNLKVMYIVTILYTTLKHFANLNKNPLPRIQPYDQSETSTCITYNARRLAA